MVTFSATIRRDRRHQRPIFLFDLTSDSKIIAPCESFSAEPRIELQIQLVIKKFVFPVRQRDNGTDGQGRIFPELEHGADRQIDEVLAVIHISESDWNHVIRISGRDRFDVCIIQGTGPVDFTDQCHTGQESRLRILVEPDPATNIKSQ